jgi:uncharacterized SAM-binding protein YcdF (DUF218 family)
MFLVKKFLTPLFYSLTMTVIFLVVGLSLLLFTRRQKAGKIVTTAGVLLILVLSIGPLPDMMLKPLEDRYPPLMLKTDGAPAAQVKWVVILGGGVRTESGLSLADQIAPNALVRLVEGIGIHHQSPGSRLLLSGGSLYGSDQEAKVMEKIAAAMKVRPEAIVLESKSRDTEEQTRFICAIVGKEPFILVTSAFHMSRAMALFHRNGAHPIAAPVNRLTGVNKGLYPSLFYPSAGGFSKADIAIHEYLGIGWLWLKSLLS